MLDVGSKISDFVYSIASPTSAEARVPLIPDYEYGPYGFDLLSMQASSLLIFSFATGVWRHLVFFSNVEKTVRC
jgi:hypothetical protein